MILKAFKNIFIIGTKGINDPIQESRIILTNKIMLYGLISTFSYSIVDLILGYYYCSLSLISLDVIFLISFYLRSKKKNSLSIFLALSASSLSMFSISYLIVGDRGAVPVMMALTGLPALTYSLSRIKLMLTNMTFNASLILISIYFDFVNNGIYKIPNNILTPLYFSLMSVSLALIALQFYVFVNEMIKGQNLYIDGMDKMNKQSRTSDLGIMSAGIAHEINNPLTIIKMHNERVTKLLSSIQFDQSKAKRSLSIVNQNCERIAEITSGLRFISQDESMEDSG